jgi:hemerythrin
MTKLIWDQSFSVGNKKIDEQHKYIIDTIRELSICLDNKEECCNVLNKFAQYAKVHFLTEEKFFLKYKYEHTNEHIKEHNVFVNYINKINNDFDPLEMLIFLEGWVITHIKGSDMKYSHLFKK